MRKICQRVAPYERISMICSARTEFRPSIVFTATAVTGSANNIAINGGNNQSATIGTAVATDPSVIVTDANNNPVQGVAVSSDGFALRFGLDGFVEPSTRAGRRFARPSAGKEILGVAKFTGSEVLIAATAEARGILAKADEVNYLSGPGKGVMLIKLGKDDRVLGFIASTGDRDLLTVETTRGGEQTISTAKYEVTGRGGKGRELLQRGQFTRIIPNDIESPQPLTGNS